MTTLTLDPHTASMLALVMGVGYVMAYAGVAKNALEWKRKRRVCPSCGRHDSCACH
jgi:NADH pyrophosphatase NudC (nudix superfamily)